VNHNEGLVEKDFSKIKTEDTYYEESEYMPTCEISQWRLLPDSRRIVARKSMDEDVCSTAVE